jgi:hypothetical protein
MLPTKFRFIWQSSFTGEDFLEINQSETRIVCGGHLGFPIGIKNRNFVENLPMIVPGQFGFNCLSGFREEAFCNILDGPLKS